MIYKESLLDSIIIPEFTDTLHVKIMQGIITKAFLRRILWIVGLFFFSCGMFTLYFTLYFSRQEVFASISDHLIHFKLTIDFLKNFINDISKVGLLDVTILLALLVPPIYLLTRLSIEPFRLKKTRASCAK
ncbi:MAG TPA: hypothetical protein PK263_01545 [bacterium]|nr:hypothetical protein [bacterium]